MGRKIKDNPDRSPVGSNGPNGLQNAINSRLRRDILDGILPPGSRLPTKIELQKQYRTTSATVQSALHKMKADGFTRSEGKRGTFVADYPPCLSNYAIVYPSHFDAVHPEVSFWRVLVNLARSNKYAPARRFTIYTDLNGHTDEPDYIRLYEDLRAQRLAGIIFASSPHLIAKTPLFEDIMSQKDLPKVAFMSESSFRGLPAVSTDHGDSLGMALNHMKNCGVRRLSVLTTFSVENKFGEFPFESTLYAEAEKRRIQLLPHNVQVMHALLYPRARQLARLMTCGRKGERPDAMLILDDSLVEYATMGIAESGLEVPGDLTVVAYCNFPEPPKTGVPVTFFGLDVKEVLDKLLEVMDRQRNGAEYPPVSIVPTEFGDFGDGNANIEHSTSNFEHRMGKGTK
ncbi:MAG: GntR family transcriptional regulator [Victivallales bacterium]